MRVVAIMLAVLASIIRADLEDAIYDMLLDLEQEISGAKCPFASTGCGQDKNDWELGILPNSYCKEKGQCCSKYGGCDASICGTEIHLPFYDYKGCVNHVLPTGPVTTAPVTTAAVTTAPVTTAPVTAAPVTTAPLTTAPVTTAPITTAPVTTAPVTTAPVTTAPLTTAPITAAPSTTPGPYTRLGYGYCEGPAKAHVNKIQKYYITDSTCKAMCTSMQSCVGYSYGSQIDPQYCAVYGSMTVAPPGGWVLAPKSTTTITGSGGDNRVSCYVKNATPITAAPSTTPGPYTRLGNGYCKGPAIKRGEGVNKIQKYSITDSTCKAMCTSMQSCVGYSYGSQITPEYCAVYGSMTFAPPGWVMVPKFTKIITGSDGENSVSCYVKDEGISEHSRSSRSAHRSRSAPKEKIPLLLKLLTAIDNEGEKFQDLLYGTDMDELKDRLFN